MEFATKSQTLKFHTEALPENTLIPEQIQGWERLSGPFRFEITLVCKVGGKIGDVAGGYMEQLAQPPVDLDAILYQPAKVGILQKIGPEAFAYRWFNGVIESIEELEKREVLHDPRGNGEIFGYGLAYRAVLVPDLARLRECFRSRIFQTLTIDELVSKVITGSLGLQSGQDFEFNLSRTKPGGRAERPVYPEREYVVQYEENDLDFIDRWLQHEGIFYLFENDGTREKVVFADSSGAYKPVNPAGSSYPYRPAGSFHGSDEDDKSMSQMLKQASYEHITSFSAAANRQPNKVRLNDYNWRDPSMLLHATKTVHEKGTGVQIQYNDHYKTPDQGAALAEVRAQEFICRGLQFKGTSSCRGFRPGKTFELTDHFRKEWNQNYLITTVFHDASQLVGGEAFDENRFGDWHARYTNMFEAIPANKEYRPRRVTGWPTIHGFMHARIDAEGKGKFAELDDHGRYKVRFPFDENEPDQGPGKASRWVRMAQPYGGPMAGMHFTLLKGTEVVISHIDGDPDRPVIAGAVPNPQHVSPTHSGNPTQNQIMTPTGNQFQMDDGDDRNGFVMRSANRSFVLDTRTPNGNGGEQGSDGGGGGEPRRRRRPLVRPATPPPGLRGRGPVTDQAVEAELQKLKQLGAAGAGAEAHAAAFREILGLDAPDEATRRARLERLAAAGLAPGEKGFAGGTGGPPPNENANPNAGGGNPNANPNAGGGNDNNNDPGPPPDNNNDPGPPPDNNNDPGPPPTDDNNDPGPPPTDDTVTDTDGDGSTVDEEFELDQASGGDPRNTQSISLLNDFFEYCAQDSNCQMQTYYNDGLALLNGKSCTAAFGMVELPNNGGDIYQLWARKFNAWLQVAWGDIGEITINNCNQYEYVNNSYSIKFGTGGVGWEQQDGNSDNTKIVNGDQKETEEIRGKQTKSSLTIGEVNETSITISAVAKASISIDATAEAEIKIGAVAKASLELDVHSTFELHAGAAIEIKIAADAKASIEITAGISFALEIAASAEFKVELKATKTLFEALASKLSVVVPKTTEVKLEELEVKLQKTDAELNNTRNTLNDTKISLNQTKTQLNQTKTQLSNTETQLNQTQTKLSKQVTALNQRTTAMMEDTTALSTNVNSLSNKLTAAIHTIS